MTIVMVLHDLNQAARYADRMVVMAAGRVVADGRRWGVLTPELLAEVFQVKVSIVTDPVSGAAVCLPYAHVHVGVPDGNEAALHRMEGMGTDERSIR